MKYTFKEVFKYKPTDDLKPLLTGMIKVKIKPLSANQLWQGRRFKTNDYKIYEKELSILLPKYKVPKGKLALTLEIGLSSKNADLDNCLKGILDIMQKKYLFNDKYIYQMDLSKRDVKKGEEYIKFRIYEYINSSII